MAEVAQLAGVSLATVSRALNSPEAVSPSLRRKVEEVAERLGYSPSPIAGSLSGAHSPLVGVIVPTMTNAFFSTTVEALTGVLEPAGYQIMVGFHEYDEAREEALVSAFTAWRPAALVVTGVDHSRKTTTLLSAAECPVVEMWDVDGRPLDTIIGFSNFEAGREAARYLTGTGRRKLICIGSGTIRDPRAKRRLEGFLTGVADAPGATVERVFSDHRGIADGSATMKIVHREHPDVEGIFCVGDALAAGAIFEAQRLGIRIPDDIAIVGFGDLDFSAYVNPSLTTVRPPHDLIGRTVAEHLLRRFEQPEGEGEVVDLGFQMIVRESA